jgi:hypothetical protein
MFGNPKEFDLIVVGGGPAGRLLRSLIVTTNWEAPAPTQVPFPAKRFAKLRWRFRE